ncbi:MAG: Peptidyl-prolyl cis-trans isomerase [Myxococcales bacterium]|nr:Peptidyl-prolyl cis-trans isomerase [Myxococcales bacterium]
MQLELARAVGHTVRPPSQLRPLKLENDHGQVKVADPDWDRVALAGLFAPFDAKNPTLAEAAAIALGRLGRRKIELDRWSRLALGLATVFTDRQVRYAAVYALAREQRAKDAPHDTEVEAALAARVTDDEPEIRAQAIAGLAKRGAIEVARKPIEDSLRDRDWRVAVEAVRALAGDHGDDAGRDAVAAALLRRWTELVRGNEADAHVVIEGEKLLAGHADRPLVIAALTALATSAPGETKVAAIARGWIECLAVAAAVRASPHPDVSALASCGHGNLPDHLRLPLVAELVSAGAGDATTRRAALRLVLVHGDARVRAAGIGALPVVWKEDAEDRAAALGTLTSALGATDSFVAGAAVDAALAIYDALPDGPSRATLDAAVVARAAVEHDVELSGSLYDLIAKQKIATGADACRAGLRGHPVRVHAAVECLRVLGEPQAVPIAEPVPPPPVDVASVINHQITWHLVTTRGEIVIALRPDVAPWNVATVVALTRKGFYDGLELHRVVPNFVAQGGDPTMTGAGGPGFSNPAEPGTARDGGGFYVGGVGMADAGRDSGGSQWFVMHSRAAYLDGRYTWIGTVRSGQKSADALLIGDRVLHATVELE